MRLLPVWLVLATLGAASTAGAAAAEPGPGAPADPVEHAGALLEAGREHLTHGRLADACRTFGEAAHVLPGWWVTHYEYVRCARLIGAPHGELEGHLRTALSTDPDRPSLHYELGLVLQDHDQPEAAMAAFSRASELAPWQTEPRERMADLALRMGDPARALSAYEALVASQPFNLFARNRLADIYMKLDRKLDAAAQLEHVARSSRYRPHALARLAELYAELGRPQDYRRIAAEIPR